ncbi:hypothetical protein [Microcystis phage Mwe-JY31]
MKDIVVTLEEILRNDSFIIELKNITDKHKGEVYNGFQIDKLETEYIRILNSLRDSIKNGYLESIPNKIIENINTELITILQNIDNPAIWTRNIDNLKIILIQFGIYSLNENEIVYRNKLNNFIDIINDYEAKIKDIEYLIRLYQKHEKFLKTLEKETFYLSKGGLDKSINTLRESEIIVKEKLNSIENTISNIEKNRMDINGLIKRLKELDSQSINLISHLENEVKLKIDNNVEKAINLIREAEAALSIRTTQGIVSGISTKADRLEKEKKWIWLIIAGIFIIISLIIGFLLTGGEIYGIKFNTTESIAISIGRIGITFISLSGAYFCANQYNKLRNLQEDYDYKVVLAKSIIAFADKIKDIDAERVGPYIEKVLNEIHQDPLRSRKSESANKDDIDFKGLEKMVSLFEQVKGILK